MKRKINQNKSARPKGGKNGMYESLSRAFDYFLNKDSGIRGRAGVEKIYIQDGKINKTLIDILESLTDSVNVLIGEPGQGKTMDIKYTFDCGNNSPKLLDSKRTVVFPVFLQSFIPDAGVGKDELMRHVREDIAKGLSAVCTMLEEETPQLRKMFESEDGKKRFCCFIQETNAKALEDPEITPENEGKRDNSDKIRTAKKNNFFIYTASKLKFYLASGLIAYNRVLIVVDNIESQSGEYRELIMSLYMKLYSCLRNFPYSGGGEEVFVNLLVTMNPATYKSMSKLPSLKELGFAKKIYKEGGIDLQKYFRLKAAAIPPELKKGRGRQLKEAADTLDIFCGKFDGKYAKMVMGLANNSIQKALEIIDDILSNPYWITRDSCTDDQADGPYVYNNITVLRSLACGSNLVYMGGNDAPIPNILFGDANEDGGRAVLTLYILAYFKPDTTEYRGYGAEMVDTSQLVKDFEDIFGGTVKEKVEGIVDQLLSCGVLGEGMDGDGLFITHKGAEIYSLLSQDSVSMEMFREDFYQEYDPQKQERVDPSYDGDVDAFRSSQDFMQVKRQHSIFVELYKLLDFLFDSEEGLIEHVRQNRAGTKYSTLFGTKTMVGYLMIGIGLSVGFSGNTDQDDVKQQREPLEKRIREAIAKL